MNPDIRADLNPGTGTARVRTIPGRDVGRGGSRPPSQPPPGEPGSSGSSGSSGRRLANASAIMAVGTVFSRLSGFVRTALLAAALGLASHADAFNVANTIPNILYILLAGGVFNAVLVPQLVRAMQTHPDGGEAYTNRVMTLAALFLAAVSVVLVLAAPLLMDVVLGSGWDDPRLAAARAAAVGFARLCLPQVFFYGMFVLVGQVLNARGRFGAMMWAPIANNAVAVLVLVVYLVVYGPAGGAGGAGDLAGFTRGQELLLGFGSTAGIVVQTAILLPYLRAAGFTFRPRYDFRDTGLGHTLRLGVWTVLFVVANQVAYNVVVRLASDGSASGGTGYTVYANAFLIATVPHAVITVSLATAALPALSARAAAGDLRGVSDGVVATLRSALVVLAPFAVLLPLVAFYVARLFLYGAAGDQARSFAPTLALFGPGILLFTVHYVLLRGYYVLEENRAVFLNQLWVAATNIVVAVVLVHLADAEHRAPALVLAYLASYAVGAALSFSRLRKRLDGGLQPARTLRFAVRLAVAVLGAGAVGLGVRLVLHAVDADPARLVALLDLVLVSAATGVVYLVLARVMRIREVTTVLQTFTGRLARGSGL